MSEFFASWELALVGRHVLGEVPGAVVLGGNSDLLSGMNVLNGRDGARIEVDLVILIVLRIKENQVSSAEVKRDEIAAEDELRSRNG